MNVTIENLNVLKNWFLQYTEKYRTAEDKINIDLKIDHSLRVCQDIITIGSMLKLNEKELILAEVIALLHDVARFEQYRLFKTFKDEDSFDHAVEGVEIIKREKLLKDLDTHTSQIILDSILYHNRLYLPQIDDPYTLIYSKLLRDADKLDIYKVVTDYYQMSQQQRNTTIELGLDTTDNISDHIVDAVLKGKNVDYNHTRYLNDFKLLQAGWVFTIYFTPTLILLKQRGYLEIIRSVLPEDNRIDQVFEKINSYITEKEKQLNR